MRWWLRLRIMVAALRKSGLRSLVAIAAVGAGIATVSLTLALSAGARRDLESILDQMGRNLFVVKAKRILALPGRGTDWFTATSLDRHDAAVLEDAVDGVTGVVPILEGSLAIELGRQDLVTNVLGVTPEYLRLRNFRIEDGRALDDLDGRSRSRVAVVGPFVAEKLNDGFSLVGERLWIRDIPFEVVGQLAAKGVSADGQNQDDRILIPIETALRRVFNVDYVSRLLVQTEDAAAMDPAREQARVLLRLLHSLDRDADDDFEMLSLVRSDRIRETNSAFVQGLARLFMVVTLVIAGTGVLAVTYLNVKDRISEVGLRMALGARRRDIVGLFVAEALFLSAVGGVTGVLLGWGGIAVLGSITEWHMALEWRGVAVALLVSAALGLIFGVGPAFRASKVTPVEALRAKG